MKQNSIFGLIAIVSFILIPLSAQSSALKKMYESLGVEANYSSPGSYQDQAAGYYTGGGLVMRQNNSTVQPINISLPRIGMDSCNKINMYFGGLSFVSEPALSELGREVISGVPTYALQLGLKTIAPQIENLLAQLRERVLEVNSMMMNSCQMRQQIFAGLVPKGNAVSQQICEDIAMTNNRDSFGAKKKCQDETYSNEKLTEAKSKYSDLMAGEYNLVWHILKKMPQYANDTEFKEFVMTLVGTVISRLENGKYRLDYVHPKADSLEYLAVFLKGGKTTTLKCDENNQCLHPIRKELSLKEGLKTRVAQKITNLRQKYIESKTLDETDQAFLSDAVTVPVYKYIQVSAASGSQFLTADATEYIAVSVLLYQFERIMAEILEAVEMLAKVQLDDKALIHFRDTLAQSRISIHQLLTTANTQAIWMLNQAIKSEEQAIIARNM